MATSWSRAHNRRPVAGATLLALPGVPPALLPVRLLRNWADDLDPPAGDTSPCIRSRRRVLVVEDEPMVAELLADLLTARGYVVRTTDTALGVVALARRERPAAILLDLGLPYRTGAALLADLKADRRTAPIPVIVVSAYTEALSPGRAALAAAVLPKPFDLQVLFDAVAAACA